MGTDLSQEGIMKKCNKCKLLKKLENFPTRKDSPDGYRNDKIF